MRIPAKLFSSRVYCLGRNIGALGLELLGQSSAKELGMTQACIPGEGFLWGEGSGTKEETRGRWEETKGFNQF